MRQVDLGAPWRAGRRTGEARVAVIGRARALAGPRSGRTSPGPPACWRAAWWQQEREAARGPLWLPVAFAAGILVYFAGRDRALAHRRAC